MNEKGRNNKICFETRDNSPDVYFIVYYLVQFSDVVA